MHNNCSSFKKLNNNFVVLMPSLFIHLANRLTSDAERYESNSRAMFLFNDMTNFNLHSQTEKQIKSPVKYFFKGNNIITAVDFEDVNRVAVNMAL